MLFILGLVLLSGCQSTNKTGTAGQAAVQGDSSVTIRNYMFQPSDLTISVGSTVTWTNEDSVPHKIVSDTGSEISSGVITTNNVYKHTFSQKGTYAYHCSIHPSMQGIITVE